MSKYRFINGRVAFPDAIVPGVSVSVEEGMIVALGAESRDCERQIDLDGCLLMPGLIDLHADAIEKEVEPRPGTFLPIAIALQSIDRRNAMCGISTVFHGLSFAEGELGVRDLNIAETVARAIGAFASHALVNHRVHVRYEITDPKAEPVVARLIKDGVAGILSFMDHSPGQGQFKEAETYRQYLQRVYRLETPAVDRLLDKKRAQAAGSFERVRRLAALAHSCDVAVASHDDEGSERIALMHELGAAFSEFPLDLPTARAARAAGLPTLFGAPNVLRGKSQSGAVSARTAIEAQLATCLCSDYAPPAMLPAAFAAASALGVPLPQTLGMLTHAPATAMSHMRSGRIAVGCQADLIVVAEVDPPVVKRLFRSGREAFRIGT